MIVENICCQGSVPGYEFYFRSKVQDTDDEKGLSDTVREALDQIDRQKYEVMLVEKGIPGDRIRKYGFAFSGKKVLIGGG